MPTEAMKGGSPPAEVAPPMDRHLDRREFLSRMTVLTAAVTGGPMALPALQAFGAEVALEGTPDPEGMLEDALEGALDELVPAGPPHRPRRIEAIGRHSRWPIRLPDPASIVFDSPAELTIVEAAALIRGGRLTPLELVRAQLERIDTFEEIYLAYNTVLRERALEEVARLTEEPWRGPLHGIPLAIKDNFFTAGVLTTANSYIFRDHIPTYDATAVARLRAAGGVILGKTQMGPLATTRATTPDGRNTTLNAWAPHDGNISPGGSSSGSATAVAAGLATSSIGTQTGGSITGPAGLQGLTGLKPTLGRISLHGVIPLSYTRDHPGPIARDAGDAAIMLQVMAGPDTRDPRTQLVAPAADYVTAAEPVRRGGRIVLRWPTTIGVLPGYADASDLAPRPGGNLSAEERERRERIQAANARARRELIAELEGLGAKVVEIPMPQEWDTLWSSALNNARLPERSEWFLHYLKDDVRWFGVSLSAWINGLLLPGVEYLRGQRAKLAFLRHVLEDLFERCDLVLQTEPLRWDTIGLPLISFPIGFEETTTGYPFPIGALLGGMPNAEDRLLSVVGAYQAVTDWHRRRPPDPTAFRISWSKAGIDRGQPMDTLRIFEEGE